MKSSIFKDFFQSERSGGFLLIFCTIVSLLISNSAIGEDYTSFWKTEIYGMSFNHWINDGLMTIFFLLVGLELEREIFIGELSSKRNAILPIMAALGGMVIPGIIYFLINQEGLYQKGFGIPMATDIAFSLTILSLFSKKVPFGLKIFLTALAIADDLGAILVIAIFYSNEISLLYLMGVISLFVVMYLMGRYKVYVLWPYLIGGVLMWYCAHHSGIHATISGVLLAFAIPFGKGNGGISHKLQHALHIPVAFFILPVFALANTCIKIAGLSVDDLVNPGVLGTILGLVIGKPLGIFLFVFLSIKFLGMSFPLGVKYQHVAGAGIVAGIGFTMSVFIAELAFQNHLIIEQIKLAILIGALISSILGILWFKFFIKNYEIQTEL
jgi:NhaA family Na+:H+ antiporter